MYVYIVRPRGAAVWHNHDLKSDQLISCVRVCLRGVCYVCLRVCLCMYIVCVCVCVEWYIVYTFCFSLTRYTTFCDEIVT